MHPLHLQLIKYHIMSRSYHKSNTMDHAFINFVCYKSNKIDKAICNRILRRSSKTELNTLVKQGRPENFLGYINPREVIDIWDFSSDGLKHYHSFSNSQLQWTGEKIRKLMRK